MKTLDAYFTRREGSYRTDLIFLLLLFGFSFFYSLGEQPLLEPDEVRYAEIPREMIESGDFVTPRLNYVKYFEKPPLHYWMVAASFKVFGQNEFAARFPGALCGLLLVLFLYVVGRVFFGRREALCSSLILGTSIGYLAQARLNITDPALTFFMTLSIGSFFIAARENEPRKGAWYYLFYAAAALAVLTKGLIGIVLPGGIIFFFMLLRRRWGLLKEMRLAGGIILFLAAAAPWFVIVSLRNPEFPRFFFIHEHFQRFLTQSAMRHRSDWYFIPVLMGCMFPWTWFLPASASYFWGRRKTPGADRCLVLWLWAGIIFIFFSVSESKLVPYILPVFPPVALIIGRAFSAGGDAAARWFRRLGRALSPVLIIGGLCLAAYPKIVAAPRVTALDGALLGASLVIEGIFCALSARRADIAALFTGICAMTYLQGIIGPTAFIEKIAEERSFKKIGLIMHATASPGTTIASFGIYKQGIPYYTHSRVLVVGVKEELRFGSRQGDQSAWFMGYRKFYRQWDSGRRMTVFLNSADLPLLRRSIHAPIRIVAFVGEYVVITNSPEPRPSDVAPHPTAR